MERRQVFGQITLHCTEGPRFPLIAQWTFGWFHFFTGMKCYEHSCTPVCVDVDFHFCQVYTQEWSFWVIWELLSDELLNSFPKKPHCLTLSFPKPLPTLATAWLFD